MEDEEADLAAAIAASLAAARPPRAASPVVLCSDDDDAAPAPRRPSATPPPRASTAGQKPRSKHAPPPPTEHELDAVFVQLSGGRDVITHASLAAASASILGDGGPGGDEVDLMMALAYELGGGDGHGQIGRGQFSKVAKRVLGS